MKDEAEDCYENLTRPHLLRPGSRSLSIIHKYPRAVADLFIKDSMVLAASFRLGFNDENQERTIDQVGDTRRERP